MITTLEIKGYVTPDEITEFIREKFDPYAKLDMVDMPSSLYLKSDNPTVMVGYGDSPYDIRRYGEIVFQNGKRTIGLLYSYRNANSYPSLEKLRKMGLEDMVKSEKTLLSIGSSDKMAKETMLVIAEEFGGWMDESCGAINAPRWIDGKRLPNMSEITYRKNDFPSQTRMAEIAKFAIKKVGKLHDGKEIYDTLAETFGMKDDEILRFYPELEDIVKK